MKLLFTFAFMLLVTVPIGVICFRYFSDGWWIYAIGFIIGLVGANISFTIYDIFLKTWMQDDGN